MKIKVTLLNMIFATFSLGLVTIQSDFIPSFCDKVAEVRHAVLFSCYRKSTDMLPLVTALMNRAIFVRIVNISRHEFYVNEILTRDLVVKTCVVADFSCMNVSDVFVQSSAQKYYNKTYEWLFMDPENIGLHKFARHVKAIGLDAQVSYVNRSHEGALDIYDLHSKGQHLGSPLIATLYGKWDRFNGFDLQLSLNHVRSVQFRRNFQGIVLRGVVVIDRNDTNPDEIDKVMSTPLKTAGISPFTKYHYSLVKILQEFCNFSVNYRITHGWSGRLGDTQFRLGLLGMVQRDEADIAASAAFDRINRFAEFDTIHQSWKFEAAFLYRITSELKDSQGSGGDFLTPFRKIVWCLISVFLVMFIIVWELSIVAGRQRVSEYRPRPGESVISSIGIVCQQGLTEAPNQTTTRIIAYVLLIFSLLLYNFYTSSVVGGLLSTQAQGPQNLTELVDSPLILSFEDIGYHRVIFKETNSSFLKDMYYSRVKPPRQANMLPAYTTVKDAIPYIKTGRYAFHCEMIDAYPDIAKQFDPNEICDLRSVPGLFDAQIMNMIVTKRSAYTEMFRIALHRAREVGLINRELRIYRAETPRCLSGFTVHPVTLNGVRNAFFILLFGFIASLGLLVIEILTKQWVSLKEVS